MKIQPVIFNQKIAILILSVCYSILILSCSQPRNLVYFSNLPPEGDTSRIMNQVVPKIETGDILGISIVTLNPEYNQLFNSGALAQTGIDGSVANTPLNNNTSLTRNGFQVDQDGNVNLPVLGKVNLRGLSRLEAQDRISAEVAKTAKEPIVNVKFLNYKVTVIGEVTRPGSFTVPDERVNVLEALGMAGDLTPYAVRENVLVIHEKDGVRSMSRVNLTDKNVFKSPSFYLQQNDVVYVQPENKIKARQADSRRFQIWSIVLSAISVITLAITRLDR